MNSEQFRQYLIDMLALAMRNQQLNQTQLAEKIGCSQPQVSLILRHKDGGLSLGRMIDAAIVMGYTFHISIN